MDNIDTLLEPGERLLWHGQPDVNRLVRRQYGWCFFAGAFMGLSLIWAWGSAQRGTAVSLFVALLFVLAGLAVLFAKVREIMAARTTRYMVTDRRAVIVSGKQTPKIDTVEPRDIGPIEITNVKDDHGDVLFRHVERFQELRGRKVESSGFIGIVETGKARQALERLASAAGEPTA